MKTALASRAAVRFMVCSLLVSGCKQSRRTAEASRRPYRVRPRGGRTRPGRDDTPPPGEGPEAAPQTPPAGLSATLRLQTLERLLQLLEVFRKAREVASAEALARP